MVTHAELAQLDPHPWNDIAVDGQGNVFVGCIGFDFPAGEFAPGIISFQSSARHTKRKAESEPTRHLRGTGRLLIPCGTC
jgi:hypothetical protein